MRVILILWLSTLLGSPAAAFGASGDDEALVLARPLRPTNENMFRSLHGATQFLTSRPYLPAAGPERLESEVRQMLIDFIAEERTFGNPSVGKRRAVDHDSRLRLFESDYVKAKVPSASLRAALVALSGTIGEPALHFILFAKTTSGQPRVRSITFETIDESGQYRGAIALVFADGRITVNKKYQAENPFLLTNTLFHEALHLDNTVSSLDEEAVCYVLDDLVYLQLVSRHPSLVVGESELTQRVNMDVLSHFNSGIGTRIGLYRTNGDRPVLPGSNSTATSWFALWSSVFPLNAPVPGGPLLAAVCERLREPGRSSAPASFSREMLDWLDQNASPFSVEVMARVARNLQLMPAQ